ncbi:MAG TPA: hypothetical protein VJX67_25030 [Blastocatellia bacterium]|nr:hypothetical protein [Blastocatellia bacterium]
MKSRLLWMLGLAVVGGALVCFSSAAVAQESQSEPNVGQQGEYNGQHVDTGVAARDTGPEVKGGPNIAQRGQVNEQHVDRVPRRPR